MSPSNSKQNSVNPFYLLRFIISILIMFCTGKIPRMINRHFLPNIPHHPNLVPQTDMHWSTFKTQLAMMTTNQWKWSLKITEKDPLQQYPNQWHPNRWYHHQNLVHLYPVHQLPVHRYPVKGGLPVEITRPSNPTPIKRTKRWRKWSETRLKTTYNRWEMVALKRNMR